MHRFSRVFCQSWWSTLKLFETLSPLLFPKRLRLCFSNKCKWLLLLLSRQNGGSSKNRNQ